VDAFAWERRESNENTYQDNCPKGRSNRAPRSGTIAIFAILTPLEQGSETARNEPNVGSIPFVYISIVYV